MVLISFGMLMMRNYVFVTLSEILLLKLESFIKGIRDCMTGNFLLLKSDDPEMILAAPFSNVFSGI